MSQSKQASMPRRLKAKWLAALRSGEYRQAQGRLYDPATKGFCSLGVLEHCALNGNVEVLEEGVSDFMFVPSLEFYEKFGIENMYTTDADFNMSAQAWLIEMNDSGGKDFSAIADFIQKNIKGR